MFYEGFIQIIGGIAAMITIYLVTVGILRLLAGDESTKSDKTMTILLIISAFFHKVAFAYHVGNLNQ